MAVTTRYTRLLEIQSWCQISLFSDLIVVPQCVMETHRDGGTWGWGRIEMGTHREDPQRALWHQLPFNSETRRYYQVTRIANITHAKLQW